MSEESKKIKFKFKPEAIDEWRTYAQTSIDISREIIKFHFNDQLFLSESVFQELNKISVNAFIFKEFLDELKGVVQVGENGELNLEDEDISNIWKCLLTLSESKKFLLDVSLSLELH